jgi:EAL domain-containing protein (putative c-di-GMP-specific phosphodiesterase class I)
VLAQACAQLANWRSRSLAGPALQISVNVSSKEFSRTDFLTDVRDITTLHGLSASSLRLEIAEGTMLERSARTAGLLAAVRALGVSVDVDDFGTGYSSLSALNHLVVDGLKLDRSFVAGTNTHHGWEIVEAVIFLAHRLGLVAFAEGIETPEQLCRLIDLGCDFGQGHLFAPALGAVAAAALLRDKGDRLAPRAPLRTDATDAGPSKLGASLENG